MDRHEVALSVRNVSKSFTIRHGAVKHSTLGEELLHRLRHPLQRPTRETFWALRDISFELNRGDVVGVIGRNGAGKSTLLKILSRITRPTKGEIDVYGRVGSLLEIGTGFHPELTGRENIFLNGTILGMSRREVARQFDAIVDFAGVERFLDTPVKRYSSGMYIRLAFAVAAHLNPHILLIDEVLAVGDAEFQQRCLGKMKDVAGSGRTVLFVSHNMQAVNTLCNRGIFLRGGEIAYNGDVRGAVEAYMEDFTTSTGATTSGALKRPGTGEYRFVSVSPGKNLYLADEPKQIHFRIERRAQRIGRPLFFSAHIVNPLGMVVAQLDSRLVGHQLDECEACAGTLTFSRPWLKPGPYRIDMFICAANYGVIDSFEYAGVLNVSPVLPYRHGTAEDGTQLGLVLSEFEWQTASASQASAEHQDHERVLPAMSSR